MEFLHIQFWSLNSKVRINNGTKQDDPKPLLTKYWISPLAVANCHRMSARVLEPHSKRGSRPYNKQTHCQRTIGDTRNNNTKTIHTNKRFIQYQKDSTLNSYEFSQLMSVMWSKLYPQMHKCSDKSSWYEPQCISTLPAQSQCFINFNWLWWPLCRWCWTGWPRPWSKILGMLFGHKSSFPIN